MSVRIVILKCAKRKLLEMMKNTLTLKPYIGEMLMDDICIRPQQTNF